MVSDSISHVSIWLLGSDKGAVISYMMALSQKKSDVPLSEHPYVIFVYMFTGSPSQQPFYGSWNMWQCYGVRFLFNVGTGSRILNLQTSLQIISHLSVNTVSENLQQTRTNNDVLTHKNNFFFHEKHF